MLKLIHTADWHLGRVLHHQSLLEDQATVLDQIIDYAITFQVDGLLVAGDIYDRAMPPAEAVRLLNKTVNRLAQAGIPLIMISGNHDSAERLGFAAEQLQKTGLHILSDLNRVTEPVRLQKGDVTVQVFGIPFADPERVRNQFDQPVQDYDQAHSFLVDLIQQSRDTSLPTILMSHCFVDGAQSSESEKTLSVGGSDRVSYEPMLDFDYVALGHLHGPQFRGAKHIRYAGSPLKYSFSEHKHTKGITLLSFDSSGLVAQQHLPLNSPRDLRVIEGLLDEVIAQGKEDPNIERRPQQERKKSRGEGTTTQSAEAFLYHLNGDGSEALLVSKKIKEFNDKIIELIGLSSEQFRQVMVLPQGLFRKLLLADSKDREPILSQLFQTHIYKRLEDHIKAQAAQVNRHKQAQAEQVKGILHTVDCPTREALHERLDLVKLALATHQHSFAPHLIS
ncbi:exonuclease subunit SbcD [Thiomicrospira sp. R3]|uniref:exonuclease subunit SbcD n=1 Tax=Thiomicrospira sp. R3 TaxID=3035472 RepID=UPI00259AF339|nr:exonuclease subunit SbcD [Thiomicrospira sp. R3]WFE68497.1 exonuclease subunit SbcD [Thiomicrospira sp. R3]